MKEEFEALQRAVSPDVIFTRWRHDLHQDHRLIAELTGRQWFSEDVFRSILRIRGMECNAPTNYAEAFYGRKLRLG